MPSLWSSTPKTAPAAPPPNRPSQTAASSSQPASTAAVSISDTIHKIDDTIETMELREKMLTEKIAIETQKAKDALAQKNKNLAVLCMKRKKLYENNLEKLMAQRGNMETIKITMEDTAMTHQILQAQRHAASELERLNGAMQADKVEEDMDRLRDAMDQQKEIQDILGQQLGSDVMEDDELLDELEDLVTAEKKAAKAAAKTTAPAEKLPDMGPSVPKAQIVPVKQKTQVEDEDDELARLEAEMNA